MKLFSEEEHNYFMSIYKNKQIVTLTDKMNHRFNKHWKVSQIRSYLQNHSLNTGVSTRFKKGHYTWNKGLKRPRGSINSGNFQKGHIPKNAHQVGTEVITHEGYIKVKVANPNRWKLKHRIVYEREYGDIPKDNVVIFIDGDKTNVSIDNLMCIERGALAILNKWNTLGKNKEINKTKILLAKLYYKRSQRKNQKKRRDNGKVRGEQT